MAFSAIVRTEVNDGVPVQRWLPLSSGRAMATVPAELDHRRLELSQLAEEVKRFRRPSGHEFEAVPPTAALQLCPDRACLSIECKMVGPARVGGQKQDGVLPHCRHARGIAFFV